jgi:NitT/TauT family transport system substrate-binding protein
MIYMPALLATAIVAGCSRKETVNPVTKQQLRICMGGILTPLPLIAKGKGLFEAEGISAETTVHGDGKAAMQAFLEGKCEMAVTGDPPIVRQSFDRNDFVIIASVSSSDNANKILARRDRGITAPGDLAGKKVAVSTGTASHYFLDQYLLKYRIKRSKIAFINMPLQEMPESLKRGDVDAIAATEIAYQKGIQAIGNGGVTFTEPGLASHWSNLMVKKDWLASNQQSAQKVLRALLQAEKQLDNNPAEMVSLLSARLKIPASEVKSVIEAQHNKVTLEQGLFLSLEDHARWMVESGIVKEKALPNYLQFIDPAMLKIVNPEAVKLR